MIARQPDTLSAVLTGQVVAPVPQMQVSHVIVNSGRLLRQPKLSAYLQSTLVVSGSRLEVATTEGLLGLVAEVTDVILHT